MGRVGRAVPREPARGDPGAHGGGGGRALGAGPHRVVQAADEGAGEPAVHRRERWREPAAAVRARGGSTLAQRQGWRRRRRRRLRAGSRHEAERRSGCWRGPERRGRRREKRAAAAR